MKHLLLFESFEVISHLKERGIDPDQTRVIIDEKTNDVYFFLYNLSGQMVGFQKYNKDYVKTGQSNLDDPRMAKYFTWVSEEGYGKAIAVWGLESTTFTDKYLFITEGIFDAARIQEAGYPAIAVLCNNPHLSLKGWLETLPQKKIVIYDNDAPGRKLIKFGDDAYTVTNGKDINDLTPEEAKKFLISCLNKSGFVTE
jgi:DNA primase